MLCFGGVFNKYYHIYRSGNQTKSGLHSATTPMSQIVSSRLNNVRWNVKVQLIMHLNTLQI